MSAFCCNYTMATKRRRTVITVAQKLEVLSRLERGERVAKLASEFGIKQQTVRDIRRSRNKLMSWENCSIGPSVRKTLRKSSFAELEEALCLWLEEKRLEGLTVTRAMIMEQAKELNKTVGANEMFTASNGWYDRFKRRNERLVVDAMFSFFSESGEMRKHMVQESWFQEPRFQHLRLIPENFNFVYCNICCRSIKVSGTGKRALKGKRALISHIEGKKHRRKLTGWERNCTSHNFDSETEILDVKPQLVYDSDDPLTFPAVVSTLPRRTQDCHSDAYEVMQIDAEPIALDRETSTRDNAIHKHNSKAQPVTSRPQLPVSLDVETRPTIENSDEVEVVAADTEEVEGSVPVQFEVITIPSSDQWRDLPADGNTLEPIATAEKNICRLCIKNEGTVPIFQDDGHLRVLAVKIMAISNVKVSSSDGLPSHICTECVDMVHSSFNFKIQCEASDSTLRATMVTDPVTIQDVGGVSKNSEIAVVSNQLNETRDKLDTLVTSMKDLQKQYNDSLRTTSTPTRQVPSGVSGTTGNSSLRHDVMEVTHEVVDITDEVEDSKSALNIESLLDFKGFISQDTGGPGCREVRRKGLRNRAGMVPFSNVPCCYLIELDSDSECEEIRNTIRPVRMSSLM